METTKEKTKTIIVGQESTEYIAFGDDSHHSNTLAYAFLIVQKHSIINVEDRINAIKTFYGIPINVTLHCKMLFSGDERKKNGIGHLSSEKVRSIIGRIIRVINQTPIFLRYAHCDLEKQTLHFDKLNNEAKLTCGNSNSLTKIQLNADPKGLLGLLAHMSLSAPPNDVRIPTVDKCQVIISEDKSKVHLLGPRRRQAHYWSEGYSDIATPPSSVFQLKPIIQKSNTSIMLQLADIAAYVCCQALSNGKQSLFFKEKLRSIKYWTSAEFLNSPPPT